MVVFCLFYPIYGGSRVYTVQYFHRFVNSLHQICTSGDAREGSPHAKILIHSVNVLKYRRLLDHNAKINFLFEKNREEKDIEMAILFSISQRLFKELRQLMGDNVITII